MERKKVLVFETTKTLMRAYELALRGSMWTLIKIQQEGRLFPAIESASPDAMIVERRALSSEVLDALGMLPIPIVFCAKEKENLATGRLYLPRPFSCDELFETLNAALEWNPDLLAKESATIEEEEEEPLVLTAPDEEDSPSVIPMETEEEEPAKTFEDLPQPMEKESAISLAAEPTVVPDSMPKTTETVEEMSRLVTEPSLIAKEDAPPEARTPETANLAADEEPPAGSFVTQIAEQVEERVVEEIVPPDIEIPEGVPLPEMIRALVRRELREVMKEYFWEEAPFLMRQVLEEEIRKLAAKQ